MRIFGLSDIGKVRELNEDCFGIVGFVAPSEDVGLAIVADGMGGHKAGEVASDETVRIVSEEFAPHLNNNLAAKNISVLLAAAVQTANSAVQKMASENPERAGMGTTVVAAYVRGGTAYIANVGDSRAYVISNGEISQISIDHSLVEDLIADGLIARSEAREHPRKHVITRAIGSEPDILVDIFEYKCNAGDVLLLCTDGLTEMIDDNEILKIVNASDDVKSAVESLVSKANENGGTDNITVVGVEF